MRRLFIRYEVDREFILKQRRPLGKFILYNFKLRNNRLIVSAIHLKVRNWSATNEFLSPKSP